MCLHVLEVSDKIEVGQILVQPKIRLRGVAVGRRGAGPGGEKLNTERERRLDGKNKATRPVSDVAGLRSKQLHTTPRAGRKHRIAFCQPQTQPGGVRRRGRKVEWGMLGLRIAFDLCRGG